MLGKFVLNESHPSTSSPILDIDAVIKPALRLPEDLTDEDNFLRMLVNSAESTIENLTRLILRPQSWIAYFPYVKQTQIGNKWYCIINVPRLPLRSVESIKYINSNNQQVTVDSGLISVYKFGMLHSEIYISDTSFLSSVGNSPYPITVNLSFGFDTSDTFVVGKRPTMIDTAITNVVGYMYQNRELFSKSPDESMKVALHPYIATLDPSPM